MSPVRKVLIGLPVRGASGSKSLSDTTRGDLAQKKRDSVQLFTKSVVEVDCRDGLCGDHHLVALEGTHTAREIVGAAVTDQFDLIFVGAQTEIFDDTITRLIEATAADPMIAFASPRTNLPGAFFMPIHSAQSGNPQHLYELFRRLSPRIPKISYASTVSLGCFYAKAEVLHDFEGGDQTLKGFNDAVQELAARANRFGYRAAIANWAYAYDHQQRFGAVEDSDHAIWRVPNEHQREALERHLSSPAERALTLVSNCETEDRCRIAFDLSGISAMTTGTSEFSIAFTSRFAQLFDYAYQIDVLCEQDVWDFHGLADVPGITRCAIDGDTKYAAIVRTSQPFDLQSAARVSSRAAVTMIVMHDAIGYDCLHIAPPRLHQLWSFVMRHSDAVVYVSEFSKNQFLKRFSTTHDVEHVVCMPSMNEEEYGSGSQVKAGSEYLLVVGNHFAHKGLREFVKLIQERLPSIRLHVFGLKLPDQPALSSTPSGHLSSAAVGSLYANAKAVVFPSHYEGFGFPIMHALANRKVIFVRDFPVYHEIKDHVAAPENIRLFKDNADLINQLGSVEFVWKATPGVGGDEGWGRTARELEAVLSRKLQSVHLARIETRLANLDVLGGWINESNQRADLQQQLIQAKQQLIQAEQQLDAVYDSTSWRITKVIRAVKKYLFGSRQ